MNVPLRLVNLLGIAGVIAVVLYMPRKVPITNTIVYPYLFGNDLALKFPVSWPLLAVYIGAIVVVAGLLSFLLRGRR